MSNHELKVNSQEYIERRYPVFYKQVQETLKRIRNEELRAKLNRHYLRMIQEACNYDSDFTKSYTNSFCRQLEELNSSELEYYLEFCLEFYEKDFERFMMCVCFTCRKVNFAEKEISRNYLRYSGKKDREELTNEISAYITIDNPDLNNCLKDISEIEQRLILSIYETAKNGSSYVKKDITTQ